MMPDSVFGATDTGRERSNNEDAFVVRHLTDDLLFAAVIDGVGGYEGGEIAASAAQEIFASFQPTSGIDTLSLKQLLVNANDKILALKQEQTEYESMACVATAMIIDKAKRKLFFAHVGDTRMYLYRDSNLIKLTKDHSFVGFLEENNKLTEEQAMNHPKRNEINKALGFTIINAGQDYIDAGESPFLSEDLLLLCSDGLTDALTSKQIAELLSSEGSLEDKCHALIESANEAYGKDNITVVIAANSKSEPTSPTQPPVVSVAGKQKRNRTPRKTKMKFLWAIVLLLVLVAAIFFMIYKSNQA
jgi:serine/threonine protein phosphatase PrpC